MLLSTLELDDICQRSEAVVSGIFGGTTEIWNVGTANSGEVVLERHLTGEEGLARIPFGRGIVGHVAETGMTVNIPDAYCDRRYDPTEVM